MSGIEVAGIVLATFPLLISALEHWRETYEAADLLLHFQREHKKCVDQVKDERLRFSLLLEILLRPLVHDQQLEETELETLLDGTYNTVWLHNDAEVALKTRLGAAYGRFMELLGELQAALHKTMASLGPRVHEKLAAAKRVKAQVAHGSHGKLFWRAHGKYLSAVVDHHGQQLRFSIDREGRRARLEELRDTNAKLKDLLDLCDRVGGVKLTSRLPISPRASKALLEYWNHAERIYHLVQTSWRCSCKGAHCALLWLHHPMAGHRSFELRLLVLWSARGIRPSLSVPPWEQQGLEITWLKGRSLDERLALLPGSKAPLAPSNAQVGLGAIQPATSSIPASPPSLGPPPAKRVKIASSSAAHSMAHTTTTPVLTTQPRTVHTIDDLCKDLSQVLQDPAGCAIKRAHRVQVALDVASTQLRLQCTSWTPSQLQSQHVLFPKGAKDDIVVDRPYISASFDATTAAQKIQLAAGPSFACLGILLMELWFGVAFDDHELWQQAGFEQHKSNPAIRIVVAILWANNVGDDAGPELAAAVKWCLQDSPSSLTGDQWRKDLAEKVVLRLQNCRDWMQKGHALSVPAQT